MKRTIAVIIERADVTLGGAERSVFELASALSLLDMHVHVLAAKGQANAKNIHVLCHHVSGKRIALRTFAKAIKKHLSENHYDIIHSTLPFDFADVYQPRGGAYAESILRNVAGYRNNSLEYYKRFTAFANFRRGSLLRAEKRLSRKPNGPVIAAISTYVAEQFKHHYHTTEQRITVISNGVKTKKEIDRAQTDKLRAQILTEFGLREADNPVFFLFAANNFRLKGLACLIEAFGLLAAQNKNHPAYLIVAGRGRSAGYRHLAKKLAIENRIVFLGKVRHIQNALAISDIAILPTFYDACSRFILEALVAEKPVITTRFNGACDLFTDSRHGKLIDSPEDIDDLAQAINYFTDTANIKKASEAIVADNLKEKISIDRVAKQLNSLYDLILQRRRR